MNWLSRQTLCVISGCVLASANYGCSREPEPGLDLGEIEAASKPILDRAEIEAASKPILDRAEIEAASKSFRQIETENRLYSRGTSTGVIRSQKALDAFLATEVLEKSNVGNEAHYSALRTATIDFSRDALCLFCIGYGTGSRTSLLGPTTLRLKPGVIPNRHMTFRLATSLPMAGLYLDTVGVDCFPMVVDSSAVDTLSWEVDGVEVYSADLTQPPLPFDTQRLRYSDAVKRVKNKR